MTQVIANEVAALQGRIREQYEGVNKLRIRVFQSELNKEQADELQSICNIFKTIDSVNDRIAKLNAALDQDERVRQLRAQRQADKEAADKEAAEEEAAESA